MLALGSFLNYTFDSGQILGARPLIISRCNCGNISADLSLCYQVPGSQTVQVVEINILQDTTRPSPLLTAQATIENYNSEYSVLLILGLHTNILVLIDKTINQISSQKKRCFVFCLIHLSNKYLNIHLLRRFFFSSVQVLGRYLSPLVTLLVQMSINFSLPLWWMKRQRVCIPARQLRTQTEDSPVCEIFSETTSRDVQIIFL